MSELQVIQSALQKAAQRRRWGRALRGMWFGLLIGAILTLLMVGAFHLFPLPAWIPWVAALVPLPFLLIGMVWGGWRKSSLNEIARWVDNRQRLKERLSTALEFSDHENAGAWRDLVVTDAAAHAKSLDPRQLIPLRLPKTMRWALVLLALGAGLGFVPAYRSKSYLQKQTDQANIKEAGRQLAELTRHNLDQRPPILEPTRTNLEAVAKLGDEFTLKTVSRSEALKDLANVAEQLKDQLKELARDPALKRLEQAARSPGGNDAQSAANLQKQMESLQKQLGTPVGNPEMADKLKKDLEKLQQEAKGLADKNSGASDADRQKLSESLSALSQHAQDAGFQLPELKDAIDALAANNTDMVLKDLQQATQDLEKMNEMAKQLQQMQQQAEKLGKDLAEQLKNGQPEAAQQTLQKMISQLSAANLSPEQMQKMMNEVSKAVNPAGNYGKVAQDLKDAVKNMQNKNQQSAAQSLANASAELDKLMQQMGDAQELQSTLNALNQASQAIGTGQGWQASQGQPRSGKGGQPGSGVGTWADENGEWNGEWTSGWDNSGVVRENEDPRGVADRGDGELSDALTPTKVKGQFAPGGQMPSITLKGVSIKGQSKLAYEEAATAAQSDAQSALSQEKVPRAYQGAVKDYFDDLKK